jgi:phosphoribosylformylglycinamidine cyclo-ligase
MAKISYKDAGVDIQKADEFVDGIKGMVHKDKLAKLGAFASLFNPATQLKGMKEPIFVSSTDGVGTKLLLAKELGVHDTVGIDLVAMNVNDLICVGATPLFFLDYVGCGKVDPAVLKQVVKGIHKGLEMADTKLIGGETAEMPGMYKEDEYDLAGFCCGIVDKANIIDGSDVKVGDAVIGLGSSGVHSNGYSLVRKLFDTKDRKKYAKMLLEPTRIYVKPILSFLKTPAGKKVKAIAHNTGGAFYNKLTKVVPDGVGMRVRKNTWEAPKVFGMIKERSGLDDRELFTTFNMGIGMAIVLPKTEVKAALTFFAKAKVDAWLIGDVIKSKEKMIVE